MISPNVYNELREKFTTETANFLISEHEVNPATKEDVINIIRSELQSLRTEMQGFNNNIKNDIQGVRNEITGVRAEITGIRSEITGIRAFVTQATWLIGILISLAVVIIKLA